MKLVNLEEAGRGRCVVTSVPLSMLRSTADYITSDIGNLISCSVTCLPTIE